MPAFVGPSASGGGGGGGGGGGSTTLKQLADVGGPEDIDIAAADRFYDSGVDMPATANIQDNDFFAFSMQYRAAGNPKLDTRWVAGRDWKALGALTVAQQGQTSFDAASADKTITGFLRRTSDAGG